MRATPTAIAALLLAVAVLRADGARGGETSVVLGTGGLQLLSPESIALESEDLFVSVAEIRIRYVFRNTSAVLVQTPAAFALPDVDMAALSEVGVDLPSDDLVNFVDATVTVDGAPPNAQLERRAFVGGEDVSDLLRRYRLAFTVFETGYHDTLMEVDAAGQHVLETRGIAEYDDQHGFVIPQWVTRTSLVWPQAFPPQQPITIELRYKPAVGRAALSDLEIAPDNETGAFYRSQFCIEGATETAVTERVTAEGGAGEMAYLETEWVQHRLSAPNGWPGPVGRFCLSIDTGAPDAILATCAPGLQQTAPGMFELETKGDVPERDLDILLFHHSLAVQ